MVQINTFILLCGFLYSLQLNLIVTKQTSGITRSLPRIFDNKFPASFVSVQFSRSVWLFATPWTAARQASLSITNSQSLLKPTSITSVMPSNHLTFFHSPLSLSSRGSLVLLHFLPWGWCHLRTWGYWYFSRQSWFQLVLHPAWHFAWCILHKS